jgi:hypothetical protein
MKNTRISNLSPDSKRSGSMKSIASLFGSTIVSPRKDAKNMKILLQENPSKPQSRK